MSHAVDLDRLADVLIAGGDARLALDRATGWNKYFCPPVPAPEMACFASCTASPVSPEGFAAAAAARRRVERTSVAREAAAIGDRLRDLLGLAGLAEVLLAPSGTDATLLAMRLLAAEQPGRPLTSILVAASETGAGVPLAASGRHFSGPTSGTAAAGFPPGMQTRLVALRHTDGTARMPEAVVAEFHQAVAAAPGRAVVHVIDCSKTGLVAPLTVPEGVDAVVDACQARLSPARVRGYLRRGWPVLITGSKFYGGPAFSGAVLFPIARLGSRERFPELSLGAVLRWAAALDEMVRFAAVPERDMLARMRSCAASVTRRMAMTQGLVPIGQPKAAGEAEDWPPSIHSFALRARDDPARLLTVAELQIVHRTLAERGVLVGQPVEIAAGHGALRIAIGARGLRDDQMEARLDQLFRALAA